MVAAKLQQFEEKMARAEAQKNRRLAGKVSMAQKSSEKITEKLQFREQRAADSAY